MQLEGLISRILLSLCCGFRLSHLWRRHFAWTEHGAPSRHRLAQTLQSARTAAGAADAFTKGSGNQHMRVTALLPRWGRTMCVPCSRQGPRSEQLSATCWSHDWTSTQSCCAALLRQFGRKWDLSRGDVPEIRAVYKIAPSESLYRQHRETCEKIGNVPCYGTGDSPAKTSSRFTGHGPDGPAYGRGEGPANRLRRFHGTTMKCLHAFSGKLCSDSGQWGACLALCHSSLLECLVRDPLS